MSCMKCLVVGREFEISVRADCGTNPSSSMPVTLAGPPVADGSLPPNGPSGGTANAPRDQVGISSSGWNVWNDASSVNSDSRDANSATGTTMTMRSQDPQVQLIIQ